MIKVKKINKRDLRDEIKKRVGKRLITITCIDRNDHFELLYHFDAVPIETLQLITKKGEKVQDISKYFPAARIYEQDIQESYNIDFGIDKKPLFEGD